MEKVNHITCNNTEGIQGYMPFLMPFVEYMTPLGVPLFSEKGVRLLFCFLLMILFVAVDHVDIPFFFPSLLLLLASS